MSNKIAAGLILFRRLNQQIEYLLLQHSYGEKHWTSPKGHVDPGEDHLTTALRETEEEAGLKVDRDYKLVDPTFKIETNYLINGTKPKTVVYWIAQVNEPNVKISLSHEHIAYKWLDLSKSLEIVGYEQTKDVLRQAHEFIRNHSHS